MKLRKVITIIAYCILAAMLISIIGMGAGLKAKQKKIKSAKAEIELLKEENARLTDLTSTLAKMDAVHCDVTIMVKNTAAFGSIHTGDLNANIEQIATYTRGEILKHMNEQDTLKNDGTIR